MNNQLLQQVLETLEEAHAQIEYLHGKYQATGSGNAVCARIRSAYSIVEALEAQLKPQGELPEPDLERGTKLLPYETRYFNTPGMAAKLGYSHDIKQYFSADKVHEILASRPTDAQLQTHCKSPDDCKRTSVCLNAWQCQQQPRPAEAQPAPAQHGGRPMTLRECMEAEEGAQPEASDKAVVTDEQVSQEMLRHGFTYRHVLDAVSKHFVGGIADARSVIQASLAAQELALIAQDAIDLITWFHSKAEPDDTPDMNAVFDAGDFREFVDRHAALMYRLAQLNKTAAPQPSSEASKAVLTDERIEELTLQFLGHEANTFPNVDWVASRTFTLSQWKDRVATLLQSAAPAMPVSEQNARFAIEGAIEYGRQGINRPPAEDHWLMPFWKIGQQLAAPAQPEADLNALRYERLRVLGVAPYGTKQLERGTVLRFQNIDAFVDADLAAYPSRGECKAAPAQTVAKEVELPPYSREIGDAAQKYFESFGRDFQVRTPATFRFQELWDAMCSAAIASLSVSAQEGEK